MHQISLETKEANEKYQSYMQELTEKLNAEA